MASRKETPDVLGEILAGAAEPAAPAAPAPPPAPKQRAPRRRSAGSRAAGPAAPPRWDYLVVSLADYHGWRPRYIDGREISNWMEAPLIHDYLGQLGEDGWELVAASAGKRLYGSSDHYQLFFKRPRPERAGQIAPWNAS